MASKSESQHPLPCRLLHRRQYMRCEPILFSNPWPACLPNALFTHASAGSDAQKPCDSATPPRGATPRKCHYRVWPGGLRLTDNTEALCFQQAFPTATPAHATSNKHFCHCCAQSAAFSPGGRIRRPSLSCPLTVSRLNLPKPNQPVFGTGATNARPKPNATVRQPRVPAALFARFSPISS